MCVKIRIFRQAAAIRQNWKCHYCRLPMWDDRPDDFASRYGISTREAANLKCTAEHILARCDGGRNQSSNIVAACLRCNQRRHGRKRPKDASDYLGHVQSRLDKGKWHSKTILMAFAAKKIHPG